MSSVEDIYKFEGHDFSKLKKSAKIDFIDIGHRKRGSRNRNNEDIVWQIEQ